MQQNCNTYHKELHALCFGIPGNCSVSHIKKQPQSIIMSNQFLE